MNDKNGRQGFIKGFLSLLIIVAILFIGISFAKPYYRYYTLKSHTKDMLYLEIGNIKAIREKIMADANELNVPLNERNLDVKIRMKVVKVKANWSEVVDFWGYYQKRLDFVMEVEY